MASILGKKPFVDKILSSCSTQQLKTLLNLINNPGEATTIYLYGHDRLLSSSNIGVNYVQLMIDEYSRRYLYGFYGFLVYIDGTHCGFFSLRGFSSILTEIEIDPVTLKYTDIYEQLSPEEFRRTIGDMMVNHAEGDDVTEEELQAALANYVTSSGLTTALTPINTALGKKLNLYIVNADFDDLESDTNFSFEDLKIGDVVYSTSEGEIITVRNINDDYIDFQRLSSNGLTLYSYLNDGGNWGIDQENEIPFGGTKLYLHTLKAINTTGPACKVISTFSAFPSTSDKENSKKFWDTCIYLIGYENNTYIRGIHTEGGAEIFNVPNSGMRIYDYQGNGHAGEYTDWTSLSVEEL